MFLLQKLETLQNFELFEVNLDFFGV